MRFEFASNKLRKLYTEEAGARRFPPPVAEAFFEVMDVVVAARDEQDLRALKGLHYHKLQGKRQHQHGLDLTNQFRLVVERREDDNGVYLVIQEIVDYHR